MHLKSHWLLAFWIIGCCLMCASCSSRSTRLQQMSGVYHTEADLGGSSALSGIVEDAVTGQPLMSVQVELDYMGTSTDINGMFSYRNLFPGKHRIVVNHIGYAPVMIEGLSTYADRVTNIRVRMKEAGRL